MKLQWCELNFKKYYEFMDLLIISVFQSIEVIAFCMLKLSRFQKVCSDISHECLIAFFLAKQDVTDLS